MIGLKEEFLKKEYWSKSEAFLLPLTGLSKTLKYNLHSYLFWDNYSIENYYLILKFTYDNYDEFLEYAKQTIFPILDKETYLTETFDGENESIMILNLSDWARDIGLFLNGRYSKFSSEAKDLITEYHTYYDRGNKIKLHIRTALDPNEIHDILGKMTAIDFIAEDYGLPLEALKRVGEVGGIYDKEKETLNKKYDYYLRKEGSPSG